MVHVKVCPFGKRGQQSTEFYKGDVPQIYCNGWWDNMTDKLIDVCKNCADHVYKAEADLRAYIEAEPDCTTCPVKGKACKVFYRDKGDNSMCRELREAEGEDADI